MVEEIGGGKGIEKRKERREYLTNDLADGNIVPALGNPRISPLPLRKLIQKHSRVRVLLLRPISSWSSWIRRCYLRPYTFDCEQKGEGRGEERKGWKKEEKR